MKESLYLDSNRGSFLLDYNRNIEVLTQKFYILIRFSNFGKMSNSQTLQYKVTKNKYVKNLSESVVVRGSRV